MWATLKVVRPKEVSICGVISGSGGSRDAGQDFVKIWGDIGGVVLAGVR